MTYVDARRVSTTCLEFLKAAVNFKRLIQFDVSQPHYLSPPGGYSVVKLTMSSLAILLGGACFNLKVMEARCQGTDVPIALRIILNVRT